jgi:hypothetical protein
MTDHAMKQIQPKHIMKALTGEILLAQVRLAKVEQSLAVAKEQWQAARERRKAAKLAVRRAKKRVRLTQERTAKTKLFLAQLENQLAQFSKPAGPAKGAKARCRTTVAAACRQLEPATGAIAKRIRSAGRSKARVGQVAAAAGLVPVGTMEVPVAVIPPSSSKATAHIVRQVEEIFTGERLVSLNKSQ